MKKMPSADAQQRKEQGSGILLCVHKCLIFNQLQQDRLVRKNWSSLLLGG